ncbi:MAG: secretin N-terminal domain-containing protein [Gammaproteobacteria bacterium]|nr:secretin N-terminal domain-containing protein [Gammaproteobacteria bacterium]
MRVLKTFCIATIIFLLNACSVTHEGIDADQEIKDALGDSMAINQHQARKNSHYVPRSVRNALMPYQDQVGKATGQTATAEEPKFDISVNNVPAKDFFMGLVDGTKYNMTVSPQVSGSISLELKNVTIPQAMEAARNTYGYEYEKTSYGYQISPKRLQTRIFTVNFIDLSRTGKTATSVGSGQITDVIGTSGSTTSTVATTPSSGSIETNTKSNMWDALKTNLEAIVGKAEGRSVVINSQSGVVIVKAYPDELRGVAQYLDDIQDVMGRQVILEAKILEVQLKTSYQAGINWKIFGLQQGSATPFTTASSTDVPTFTSAFTLSITDGSPFNSIIQLLNTQGKVNVLSSPRISTLNNQTAVIKVGNDRFFVTNVTSNIAATTTNPITSQNITLTPFFSGISLDVTPQIDQEGVVTLHIHPIVSQVTQDTQKFVVNGQPQDLPLAQSTVRESDSIVSAKNGQIIVIGGLMENGSTESQTSTPGFDRLPDLKGLFKNTNNQARKFELIILLRPIVVDGTRTWQKRLQEAGDTVREMQCGEYRYEIERKKQDQQDP